MAEQRYNCYYILVYFCHYFLHSRLANFLTLDFRVPPTNLLGDRVNTYHKYIRCIVEQILGADQ